MKREAWYVIPVAAFFAAVVGMLVQLSCSHVASFEKCVTEHAEKLSAMRVQAAVACHGDHSCIEQSVIDDVQLFAGMAEQCKADSLDGGGK